MELCHDTYHVKDRRPWGGAKEGEGTMAHRQYTVTISDEQWRETERRRAEASKRAGYPVKRAAIIREALSVGLGLAGASNDDSNRAAER